MSKSPKVYTVMRHYECVCIGTHAAVRTFLLCNLPGEYHARIMSAPFTLRGNVNLRAIASESEYCAVREYREGDMVATMTADKQEILRRRRSMAMVLALSGKNEDFINAVLDDILPVPSQ